MPRRQLVRGLAAVGAVGLGTGGLVAGVAAPALAFTGTCPTTTPTAVLVADDVCEVRFTASGTFTPPSGITKLSAVLIGAGAGAIYFNDGLQLAYAGNGGEILYIDSVTLGADLNISVGAGGLSAGGSGGGDTSLDGDTAAGGLAGGGTADCIDAGWEMKPGDGAGSVSSGEPDACIPGEGLALSDIPSVDPVLWPAAADGGEIYSAGGSANLDSDPAVTSPFAGSGAPVNTAGAATAGADGLVILRFAPAPPAPTGPSLAATGSEFAWPAVAAGSAAVVGGVLLLTRRRRATQD